MGSSGMSAEEFDIVVHSLVGLCNKIILAIIHLRSAVHKTCRSKSKKKIGSRKIRWQWGREREVHFPSETGMMWGEWNRIKLESNYHGMSQRPWSSPCNRGEQQCTGGPPRAVSKGRGGFIQWLMHYLTAWSTRKKSDEFEKESEEYERRREREI